MIEYSKFINSIYVQKNQGYCYYYLTGIDHISHNRTYCYFNYFFISIRNNGIKSAQNNFCKDFRITDSCEAKETIGKLIYVGYAKSKDEAILLCKEFNSNMVFL